MSESIKIASELRNQNKYCEVFLTGNFKKKLEKANKLGTEKAILIFEQENGDFEYKLKNFKTGEETICTSENIFKALSN